MKLRLLEHAGRAIVLIMLIGVVAALAASRETWASPAQWRSTCGGQSTVLCKETDLSITKSAHPDGDTFVFVITVTNNGTIAAEDVNVTDELSKHFELVSVNGANCSGKQTVKCKLGTLNAGASVTIEIRVKVKDDFKGSITNIATVSSKTKDPNPGNNKASAGVTVVGRPVTDLSISKKAKAVGSNDFIFTITVKNNGKSAAEEVVVTDQLSRRFELEYVNGATCSGEQTIICSLGTLAPGKSVTINIRVDVQPDNFKGSISNTATVRSSTKDSNSKNNSSSVKVKAKGHR